MTNTLLYLSTAQIVLVTFSLFGLICLTIIGVLLLERTSKMDQLLFRMETIETYLRDLSSTVNDAQLQGSPTPVFRSIDGKYEASSLEELIQMMQANGEGPASVDTRNMTEDQMRKFIDSIQLDDDDEDTEPWKKS